jgi:hypothetical protein
LNEYVFFVKQSTEVEFKKILKQNIENEIRLYNDNIDIAKEINLENLILKTFDTGNVVVNEPASLFYKGSKVLSKQKLNLDKLLKETENLNLKYNPIREKVSYPILITKQPFVFMAISFILGLFFSFVVIFIKSVFLR